MQKAGLIYEHYIIFTIYSCSFEGAGCDKMSLHSSHKASHKELGCGTMRQIGIIWNNGEKKAEWTEKMKREMGNEICFGNSRCSFYDNPS